MGCLRCGWKENFCLPLTVKLKTFSGIREKFRFLFPCGEGRGCAEKDKEKLSPFNLHASPGSLVEKALLSVLGLHLHLQDHSL